MNFDYKKENNNRKHLNGLQKEIKFCNNCTYSNQKISKEFKIILIQKSHLLISIKIISVMHVN